MKRYCYSLRKLRDDAPCSKDNPAIISVYEEPEDMYRYIEWLNARVETKHRPIGESQLGYLISNGYVSGYQKVTLVPGKPVGRAWRRCTLESLDELKREEVK